MRKIKALVDIGFVDGDFIIKNKVYDLIDITEHLKGIKVFEIVDSSGVIYECTECDVYGQLLLEDVTHEYRNDIIDGILS